MKPELKKRLSAFLWAAACLGMLSLPVGLQAQNCWLNLPPYPSNTIQLGVYPYYQYPDSYSFFTASVTNGVIPASPPLYSAWCIDAENYIDLSYYTFTPFSGYLFSTCDTNLNSELGQGNPEVGYPASVYVSPDVWKEVDYMLNHRDFTKPPYSGPVAGFNFAYYWDVQEALNVFVGGPRTNHFDTVHPEVIQALTNAAVANAASWQPQCGDSIAAVAYLDPTPFQNPFDDPQLIILEVPYCTVNFTKCAQDADLGCNPPFIPSCDISQVAASSCCGRPVSITCSNYDSVVQCHWQRVVTYTATDGFGNTATCTQTLTWTSDTNAPTITTVPPGGDLGCNPASLPTDDSIKALVQATDDCTLVYITVTHVDGGTPCASTRTFTITAADSCGNVSKPKTVVYTWKADKTPPNITCPPDVTMSNLVSQCCGFTQGGWGAPCQGNNPGTILSNCFSKLYPSGYVECGLPGWGGHSIKFSASRCVQAFLPCGGPSAALNCDALNPTSSSAGVFAGQVLCLQLNVDCGDHKDITGFSGGCGDLVLHDTDCPLNGKKVRDILALCHTALGGGSLGTNHCSISDLNSLCDNLNNAFDGCQPSDWCRAHLLPPAAITNYPPSVTGYPTVTDNCDQHPGVTYSDVITAGQCADSYTIARTWVAVDSCGNTNTCTQHIFVGNNSKASVCGKVFADCDGSGDLTGGDVGLAGVLVTLLDSKSNIVTTATTDPNGGYCILNLNPGTYTVKVAAPTGYTQTAGSTCYHWKDNYNQTCWVDNDSCTHCKRSDGVDCWTAKDGCQHWKNYYGWDCWTDKYGYSHSQPCTYTSCDSRKDNCETFTLGACDAKSSVNFAYTGTQPKAVTCVTGPSRARCYDTITYTCTVTNTGNVCFTKGCQVNVCGNWYNCPPLSPGDGCSFQVKYCVQWSDCYYGLNCQATANCYPSGGNTCTARSSSCYTQCSWW